MYCELDLGTSTEESDAVGCFVDKLLTFSSTEKMPMNVKHSAILISKKRQLPFLLSLRLPLQRKEDAQKIEARQHNNRVALRFAQYRSAVLPCSTKMRPKSKAVRREMTEMEDHVFRKANSGVSRLHFTPMEKNAKMAGKQDSSLLTNVVNGVVQCRGEYFESCAQRGIEHPLRPLVGKNVDFVADGGLASGIVLCETFSSVGIVSEKGGFHVATKDQM